MQHIAVHMETITDGNCMDSRRDFIKKALLLAAGSAASDSLPLSIQKALAIDPDPGTTWQDAEHVVLLMQENRSFDHVYGSLSGVRGFNDPRTTILPDGKPVWLQTNAAGETFAPFRLNIKDTKATWMGSLPHSWTDQVDARNDGKHDRWLDNKKSGHKDYAGMPLTLGYYTRADLPFYYALADAFTVCDQNFCSSLTGTTPNRLYLWTGAIREQPSIASKANVRNEDVDYGNEAHWTTFPERLEEAGVSWRIYQNELSLPSGLTSEEDGWLSNFTDNPIEWFTQYQVRFAAFRRHQAARLKSLEFQLAAVESQPKPWPEKEANHAASVRAELENLREEMNTWSEANFAKLPVRNQNLHRKAFTTNDGDPYYRELASATYRDEETERQMRVPKGDVFYQFRKDVREDCLPSVSWLVAPANFSDHPGAPWYGAWYVSEALDILTQNPKVWKKTIFILCYDENDGYFDHVPPFVSPYPDRPETGRTTSGIDVAAEHVSWEQELKRQKEKETNDGRSGPIGLGYRVPLVIASPWSRGGRVCSQVFDHTSILQFLEKFLSQKTQKTVRETNISSWRRAVCGDLSSVFRPWHGEPYNLPAFLERDAFVRSIHQAQFKAPPAGYRKLTSEDVSQIMSNPRDSKWLPRQEQGLRPACALPYELSVDGALDSEKKSFAIRFAADNKLFRDRAAGAPFHVYAPVKTKTAAKGSASVETGRTWSYAVEAGKEIQESWPLSEFETGAYHLRVHGPNGFYREFQGAMDDPVLSVSLDLEFRDGKPTGNAVLSLANRNPRQGASLILEESNNSREPRKVALEPAGQSGSSTRILLVLDKTFGWYDAVIRAQNSSLFKQHYAGHIETGRESFSDPQMGGMPKAV